MSFSILCRTQLSSVVRNPSRALYATRSISISSARNTGGSASTPPTSPFAPRHFLSIDDLTSSELVKLVDQARKAKHAIKAGETLPSLKDTLTGKTVAMMFSKRSTRTRVSTEAAVVHLGGHPMFLGKDDIQLGVNESLLDTSKVISSMASCMVARVGPHSDVAELSKTSTAPVINALSDAFHPLQAVTDILTITESFPDPRGIKLAWVGDANNVLYDLAIACAKFGINISIATPSVYPVPSGMLQLARNAADLSGSSIETIHEPEAAVKGAHIIVTDTWVSMGQESEKALRLKQFAGFQVSSELAERGGANKDWRFMHCLPRKPEEVTDEVFYSPRSLVFPEAENRLYAAIAALEAFVVRKGNF
ncbi:ornithine carbamoyltransferase [Choiromyces venosus 120613-1]|uniref:Ornithine carbamoyltransferase, mitochondrial n=1 Tax=Choiromyces venosus 120613-1 TaxID=1336337 RepID=A0A3N4J0U5_9PEZI|nr:ornithine carbamoyltransferase [Choiromyces venosus 120613-1]